MTEKRLNLLRKKYIRITSRPIIPRSYIIGIAFSYALLLLSSCVAPLQLPSEHEVPRQEKLPIDGTWELQFQTTTGAVFKIEAGRMYVWANYGSRAWHGMVVAKNIRQISPLKYVCEYVTVNKYTQETSFDSGEIEVLSNDKLRVRYFDNRVRDDIYKKVGLDDDALFLSQLKPEVSQPPKANSIKTPVLGTGWPVQGGYIVTNWHIVQDCSTIVLIRPDGVKIPATLLVRDQANDIALLRTDSLEKLPAALPLASTPPGGEQVYSPWVIHILM